MAIGDKYVRFSVYTMAQLVCKFRRWLLGSGALKKEQEEAERSVKGLSPSTSLLAPSTVISLLLLFSSAFLTLPFAFNNFPFP